MNDLDIKKSIEAALKKFETQPLAAAAFHLFEVLGYSSQKRLKLTPNTLGQFLNTFANGKTLNDSVALPDEWKSIDFLFQLTDDEIRASSKQQILFESKGFYAGAFVNSYLFFALELKGTNYSRTALAGITREINKLFAMPAIVLFRHGGTVTLAVIPRRQHKRDEGRDVLEKVTLIKDIGIGTAHRAHIEILFDLSIDALHEKHSFSNFVELQKAWQKTLVSSELNKRFFLEISNWYFWASEHVSFPKPPEIENLEAYQSLSLIRLITRVIFCWFLKEKGLIPRELFDETRVRDLLTSVAPGESTYYRAILQNLFFATLSVPMNERRFIGGSFQGKSNDYGKQYVYRFADHLRDHDAMRSIFKDVPFLNGGLFECLDKVPNADEPDIVESRMDGFSTKAKKQAHVPNFLLLGDGATVDLRQSFGDEPRYSRVKVRPLIEIFDSYKFTVAESTPVEEEIALDPELLGMVFENLLASFNAETKSTARKQTGAFYTPREVVDYMVDEALIAHFKTVLVKAPELDDRLRHLFAYTEAKHRFTAPETQILLDAIDSGTSTIKILDPACGSGAFPMGILHRLVFLLQKLDPGNAGWRERQLERARSLDVGREAAVSAVEAAFARGEDDYARKLYLIENCIYGVDINPIACQIAKLRVFISLIVDQEPDETRENRGIMALPNLETKFVAANTLFLLYRRGGQTLLTSDAVRKKVTTLLQVRHDHFNARHWKDKQVLRRKDKRLREEIADQLRQDAIVPGHEADRLKDWDPYAPNDYSEFFDPEWMFGLTVAKLSKAAAVTLGGNLALINEAGGQQELLPRQQTESGFDILIGNPPYVRHESIKEIKSELKADYYCYSGTADLFVYFIERSLDLLKTGGILSFITSNKYFRAGYGERLRYFVGYSSHILHLIDFGDANVFTAIAYPSIVIAQKVKETRDKGLLPEPPAKNVIEKNLNNCVDTRVLVWEIGPSIEEFPRIFLEKSFFIPQQNLTSGGWRLQSTALDRLLDKIRKSGTTLGEYVKAGLYYGIKTGFNDGFVVPKETRDRLICEHKSSAELLKPFIRGRDVKRWGCEDSEQYLILIESSENKEHPWSDKPEKEAERIFAKTYPAIYAFQKGHRQSLKDRTDQGRFYWELRSCDYWKEFEHTKILYPDIYEHQSFFWDDEGRYAANTCYFIPTNEKWLTALLNSWVVEWYYSNISNRIRGGYLRAFSDYMRQIPIPIVSPHEKLIFENLISYVQWSRMHLKIKDGSNPRDPIMLGWWERILNGLVYELYFAGELHDSGLHIFDLVGDANFLVLESIPESRRLAYVRDQFERTYASDHSMRGALHTLSSLETVRTIEREA